MLLSLALAACSPATADVPAAQVAASSSSATGTFAVERATVSAVGSKLTGSHPVDFPVTTATVRLADGVPVAVDVLVSAAGLTADVEKLTGHLRSGDFFDVERWPTATFSSTSVDASGESWTVTGDLTIRDVTKRVSFPASIRVGDTLEASASFSIDRQDFGIVYPGMPDDLIRDTVPLSIELSTALGEDGAS